MPVSVKLLLKSLTTGRELVVKGYVNTGFMADSPDIAIGALLYHLRRVSKAQSTALS